MGDGNKGAIWHKFAVEVDRSLIPPLEVSLASDMFRSAGLGLLVLLWSIGSIGHTFKSFILRYLLCWPHVLRDLGRIWSLCSRTTPKDVTKKRGQARPSFPGALGVCEGYGVFDASHDFNRAGEPHLAGRLLLGPIMEQLQSPLVSPSSSHAPSLDGSPRLSNRRFSVRSITPSITGSYNTDNIQSPIRRCSNTVTPLTLTNSRVTLTQFAGTRPRSRSPSASFPSRSRPPSPSPIPFQFLPQSSTQEIPEFMDEGSR
ncbi:hypothetical protein EDB87DRAFT_697661 [Lactarius vividus]|nr:hypothetical protein EDB87DRAFT_697661 [Lactarius vividus]